MGFNFLKLPPARKARKNVGGRGEVKVHLPQALSLLSLQKQPKWQNRWIRRIFKQTGKQTKGVLCVTILVPFGNVCKYLPNYYSAILEKFIHIIYLLQKVKRGAREKICCTLGWHVIRNSIVFTHVHTYQAFFKGNMY